MKKMRTMLIALIAVMVMALGAVCFAACGGNDSGETGGGDSGKAAAKITETYIGKHTVTETTIVNDQNGDPMEHTTTYTFIEQLQLLDDGTYAMVQLQDAGMATYIVYATGKYTKNAKDAKYDGYTEIVLQKASYVQVNQDIYGHMFGLTIDTETSTFPHEIAGGAMKTKEEIINEYGDFGSRFIMHRASVDDTHAENWVDVEDDVEVVE